MQSDPPNRANDQSELRSFGRRRGRRPSDRQSALMRDVLPKVAVDLSSPPPLWGRPGGGESELLAFGIPPTPYPSPRRAEGAPSARGGGRFPRLPHKGGGEAFLEIGFGGGEHLVWPARNNPDATLIGCEPFEDGVMKVLTRIADDDLKNIRLHMGDARDVLRWLPANSISRAFILFPDPWPKRKHRKRRLVNPNTLTLLARIMKPGAELRIGTDIGDYARTILQAFSAQTDFTWIATGPEDWRIRPADWPETRYEQKAEREGRRRYYLRFSRN